MYLYICIALSSVNVHAQHSCKMPKTMAWILVYEIEFIGFETVQQCVVLSSHSLLRVKSVLELCWIHQHLW